MNRLDYWSETSNPRTGAKFEAFLAYLRVAHNGAMDVDGFIDSEYGEEFARRLETRFTYEDQAMSAETLAYYRTLGLHKEMFNPGDYYERWTLFTPLDMQAEAARGKKYPLVFSHHGGGSSIETDEFSTGYTHIAGHAGFMVAFLQNTNWQNVDRVLEFIAANYPLDRERVYASGFSQGGYQTQSARFRIPEKLTAVAPCGNDLYRAWDNHDDPFSQEEHEHLRRVVVPFFQMTGCVEASGFVPLTDWKPRKKWDEIGRPETYVDARVNDDLDPTRIHIPGKGYRDPVRVQKNEGVSWGQCTPPRPPADLDVHGWMMGRMNKAMWLLDCDLRDSEKCLCFAHTPEDELHHVLGMYGDREEIRSYYGYKHYTVDIFNHSGLPAFRYISAENCPHWPYVMMGELAWEFFKQFRRDASTGQIVADPYTR